MDQLLNVVIAKRVIYVIMVSKIVYAYQKIVLILMLPAEFRMIAAEELSTAGVVPMASLA